jgi:hypothetical protein
MNELYLVDGEDFTRSLLDLGELFQKVPETGFSNNIVWSKKSHSKEFWGWFLFGRKFTTNNLIFV